MKFKEYFGKKSCDDIKKRLNEAFENDESVFIIIGTSKPGSGMKVTDAYMGVCPDCVIEHVEGMVKDAAKKGLLSPHGRFNLN